MIYEKTDNFYIQKIYLTCVREWRFEFFAKMCQDKKILHIGCADAMAFKPDSNLHIYLSNFGGETQLEGMDIDQDAIKELEEHCPGTYYSSYDQVNKEYDIVLVPEVMEHVPDVKSFLDDIFAIKSREYIITVPSIFAAQVFCDDSYTLEMIHPDHKYWFSPYTLYKTILPYTENCGIQMYYLENKSQVGIRVWRKTEEELQKEAELKEIEEKKSEEDSNSSGNQA